LKKIEFNVAESDERSIESLNTKKRLVIVTKIKNDMMDLDL